MITSCNVAGCHNEPLYQYSADCLSDETRTPIERGASCSIEHLPSFLTASRDLVSLPSFTRLEYELIGSMIGCTHGIVSVEKIKTS
jgi:hypothetical protein